MKKHLISVFLVAVVGLTPIVAGLPAYAASTTTVHQNFWDSFVSFFAQKFGLDQNQVKSAVSDFQTQHKEQVVQNMQDKEKSRLDSLVSQGKITSSQEQAILSELAKLQQEYNPSNLKNLTPQERQKEFQKQQQELQDWAKSQGIDPNLIRPGFGMTRGRMHKGWFGGATITPTPTQ